MTGEMGNSALKTADQEFLTPTEFSVKFKFPYSTLSGRIRKGEIALHQFQGEPRPKINVAEALRVVSTIKRPYTLPTLRLV